jgi:hypothetical protein
VSFINHGKAEPDLSNDTMTKEVDAELKLCRSVLSFDRLTTGYTT